MPQLNAEAHLFAVPAASKRDSFSFVRFAET